MAQFKALLSKNWVLYKRSKVGNVIEFLIPILFTCMVILIKKLDEPQSYAEQSYINNPLYAFSIKDDSRLSSKLKNCRPDQMVALVPKGHPLVTKLSSMLTGLSYRTNEFQNQATFTQYVKDLDYLRKTDKICFGIVVTNPPNSNDFTYKLRFNISTVQFKSDGPQPDKPLTVDQAINLNIYDRSIKFGMIGTNNLVNTAILQLVSKDDTKFLDLNIAPIYQEEYILDNTYQNLGRAVGLIVILPLLLIYLRQTSTMLSQKQKKIRESMSIMGMNTGYYYLSWFIRYIVVYTLVHVFCSAIIVSTLTYAPFYLVLILFILFDMVIIVQNFFIQVFLTRAKIGVVVSLLFFVLQYIVTVVGSSSDDPTIDFNKAVSIIPHAAINLAFQTIAYAQSFQITPDFSTEINNYCIGYAVISFILNIVVYSILTWYLDQVVPNEWGAKKHPLFCFKRHNRNDFQQKHSTIKKQFVESEQFKEKYEPLDQNLKILQKNKKTIDIVGLRKQFKSKKTVAVDNLNISMYNNQIFSLLGHNGAGKTTTISMLTGMIAPTSGFIQVFGETQLFQMRKMIGICPQHDTLYDDLTVQEHIRLFGNFKGIQGQELEQEITKLIADVNLQEKRDEYSKNLSGGQKRRLSVALAFVGRSKVIILDEPTSGMDTSARRYIWQLLKTYKNDRIIILTTHFMDQADYLGDRIGIMAKGKMVCCGSSIFLKNRFGVGYNITFTKAGNQVNSKPIINLVTKYIPNMKVGSNIATQLSIQLPLESLSEFPALFQELDNKKQELQFAQYGISITTLEQVFLRVAEQAEAQVITDDAQVITDDDKDLQKNKNQLQKSLLEDKVQKQQSTSDIYYDDIPRQTDKSSQFAIHFKATMLKRLRIIKRDLKSFMFQLLLPFIIMIIALNVMSISVIYELKDLPIGVNTYLPQQNPLIVPIASDSKAYATQIASSLTFKYGSTVQIHKDSDNISPFYFDKNYLFDLKKNNKFLAGGIFYNSTPYKESGNTFYSYNSIVNTRVASSFFFLQSLAAQSLIQTQVGTNVSINVVNAPMPRTQSELQIKNTISSGQSCFFFSLALAFKFASVVSFIVKEREDRSKHQQLISGMNISAYWIANFVYDFVLYFVLSLGAILLCSVFSIQSLTKGDAIVALWLLFILYGLAYISCAYVFSFIFKDYGNAQAGFFFITFLSGAMLPSLLQVLRVLTGSTANTISRGVSWILRLFPPYAFGQGLLNLGSKSLYGNVQNGGIPLQTFDLQVCLAPILYLFIQSFIYLMILFLIEKLLKTQSFIRKFTSQGDIQQTRQITEQDVLEERQKALKADPSQYQIVTKNLRKVFMLQNSKKHKLAVDNLSFTVKKGEVFGLLGINGAGKSTTFKMLSGQITSTAGDSYFQGLKISENLDLIRQSLGYCPQFDALIPGLTVRQQLQLFYDLKSLKKQYKEKAITCKMEELNLTAYQDKLSGTLSGGNKRKLSVAMAMIGNPKIVFLDQPSTGMDPKARRFMWRVISRVATEKQNTTVILTTHSMEEAQALSTRLAIMVKGNFQCIGTPQHIKSKYGQGFQIQVKLTAIQKATLQQQIKSKGLKPHDLVTKQSLQQFLRLLGAKPEDVQQISENGSGNYIFSTLETAGSIQSFTVAEFVVICRLHRQIIHQLAELAGDVKIIQKLQSFMRLKVQKKCPISKLFEFFEKNKLKLSIQQYTIKQATVEQIFNVFAEQEEQQN